MDERDWLARRFEDNRSHLRAVAYRMLGSSDGADDAVQEAWIRLERSDAGEIGNLKGWLTTVVARVCLDTLRSRASRREASPAEFPGKSQPIVGRGAGGDPEHEALLADSIGPALLAVLETLTPAERLAFVLHDTFGVPFAEIAPTVGRSPAAAKMLASRARRRVRGAASPDSDLARQREVVGAFLAASREGDFGALLAVLDPNVVLRADHGAALQGASKAVCGASAVAETFFSGRARAAQPALVNGAAGAVWAPRGRPRVVFGFAVAGGKIVGIDIRSIYSPNPSAYAGSTSWFPTTKTPHAPAVPLQDRRRTRRLSPTRTLRARFSAHRDRRSFGRPGAIGDALQKLTADTRVVVVVSRGAFDVPAASVSGC